VTLFQFGRFFSKRVNRFENKEADSRPQYFAEFLPNSFQICL